MQRATRLDPQVHTKLGVSSPAASPIRVHLMKVAYDILQHPPWCLDEVDTVLGVDQQDTCGALSLVALLAGVKQFPILFYVCNVHVCVCIFVCKCVCMEEGGETERVVNRQ